MRIHAQRKRLALAVAFVASGAVAVTAAGDRAQAESVRAAGDPGISLEADVSERKLIIRQGNDVVETFAVAVGKGSKPTPRGRYTIRKIVWNPAWIPPDEP